jgi:hypothetical protein
MIAGQVRKLEFITKQKVWVFPPDRFVQYGPEDEWWARKYGFGHEEVQLCRVVIPHAVITGIKDGKIKFRALANYGVPQ